LLGDYRAAFRELLGSFPEGLELCPGNRLGLATATAVEWALFNPDAVIVTSFGGVGGFAPTEELLMALGLQGLRAAPAGYGCLPEMAELFEQMARHWFRGDKAVIGRRIYAVESGIHVDGISKEPRCYEPFCPEAVGQRRSIVLGKQSGAASVRLKLRELAISCNEASIAVVLNEVKRTGTEKNGALSDDELTAIVYAVEGPGACPR
jgi:homocitrate synthase NifV